MKGGKIKDLEMVNITEEETNNFIELTKKA